MTHRSFLRHSSSDFLKGMYLLLDEQWAHQLSLCALMRQAAEQESLSFSIAVRISQ